MLCLILGHDLKLWAKDRGSFTGLTWLHYRCARCGKHVSVPEKGEE